MIDLIFSEVDSKLDLKVEKVVVQVLACRLLPLQQSLQVVHLALPQPGRNGGFEHFVS